MLRDASNNDFTTDKMGFSIHICTSAACLKDSATSQLEERERYEA